jgi:5'-3' exonuclease
MHESIARGYLLARVMIGDPSDNIPGVPGLGEQRAWDIVHSGKDSPLGKNFATPKELFKHYDGKYRAKLDEHRDTVRRFWKLMNLKLSAEAAYGHMRVRRSNPDRKAFARVCRQLDFDSIMSDFLPFFNTFVEAWERRQWQIPKSMNSSAG